MGIIVGFIPESINDIGFINSLPKVGYKKTYIHKSEFDEIDKIFTTKDTSDNIITLCKGNVYRDILIFKKANKVIGIAKICFSCKANRIDGSSEYFRNFGESEDYQKLGKLLYK